MIHDYSHIIINDLIRLKKNLFIYLLTLNIDKYCTNDHSKFRIAVNLIINSINCRVNKNVEINYRTLCKLTH